jgi:4'-phosphopantetheinyl transferase
MEEEPLDLWCAYPEDASTEAVTERCAILLSEDERAHCERFRFDRHRREYLTTRALVRSALSYYRPLAPKAWHFESNTHGKPSIHPDCGLRFNLSNSPGLVVCLISQGAEVGVDAEPYERAEKIAELGPEIFSPDEIAQLATLHSADKLDRALSLWTLKEAYIKAMGAGLTLPLNTISFLLGEDRFRLERAPSISEEPPRHWRFCLLDHAGHRVAIMAATAAVPKLQLWEARPVFAPPAKLPTAQERWFSSPYPA